MKAFIAPDRNMGNMEDEVMAWYCFATFSTAATLFGVRHLLLRDASNSRISKAADYAPVVEVRVLWSFFLLLLSSGGVVALLATLLCE